MIDLSVSNFGPITRGAVTVRPLTILVGPNNSGKSYFAMLLYSAFRAASGTAQWYNANARLYRSFRVGSDDLFDFSPFRTSHSRALVTHHRAALVSWFEALAKPRTPRIEIAAADMPQPIRELLDTAVRDATNRYASALQRELQRCYGATIDDLQRQSMQQTGFGVRLSQHQPSWSLALAGTGGRLTIQDFQFNASQLNFSFNTRLLPTIRNRLFHRPDDESSEELLGYALSEVFNPALAATFEAITRRIYYLPAARSGILQSHKALASFMVGHSSLVGIEPFHIPQLTGVVADFISLLILMERERKTRLSQVAEFLEGNVIQGDITLEAGGDEYPEIFYSSRDGAHRFALHRTSSMVSELAPVVLLLKYIVKPGDVLILEEPESHLHPASRLRMAEGIVQLVRLGVNVVITTHSDYFLTQISDMIRSSRLTEEERIELGHQRNSFLNVGEVGAYLFRPASEDGASDIHQVPIDEEEGISQEGIDDVALALYEESVRLQRMVID